MPLYGLDVPHLASRGVYAPVLDELGEKPQRLLIGGRLWHISRLVDGGYVGFAGLILGVVKRMWPCLFREFLKTL